MITATLQWVKDDARTYETQHGPKASILVGFEDGTKAELTTNPDKVADRITKLKEYVGKPAEWGLEDKGTFPSGDPKPKKIVDWPGKPQGGFPQNGKPRGRSAEEIASIEKQVALKAAVEVRVAEIGTGAVRFGADDVIKYADEFFNWLRSGASSPEGPSSRSNAPSGAPDQAAGQSASGQGSPAASTSEEGGVDNAQSIGEGDERLQTPSSDPPPGGLKETCSHEWQPAPRAGWQMCPKCGRAEKK